jgi:short subunit dehydrogenase-like uncharacterized protein
MEIAERKYDIVVFGASGFTGKLVVEHLSKNYKNEDLKWAVAGRNQAKLKEICEEFAIDSDRIIIADVNKKDSLKAMAKKTKVILTTVGPYLKYGDAVVEACVEMNTHYCDLTGEVPFIHNCISRYDEKAKAAKVKIVHSAGFDAVPSDIGTLYLQEAYNKESGSYFKDVQYYLANAKGGFSRGTIDSLAAVIKLSKEPEVAKLLANANSLTDLKPLYKEDQKKAVFDKYYKSWTAPFMMESINTRLVRRTNFLKECAWGEDFSYHETSMIGKGSGAYLGAETIRLTMAALMASAKRDFTWNLTKKILPKEGGGPSKKDRDEGFFICWIQGNVDGKPSRKVVFKGPKDPGYGSTSIMLAETAICLAKGESNENFGVSSTASLVGTALVDRLRKFEFSVEYEHMN